MSLRVPLRLTGLVVATIPLYTGWILTRPLAWLVPALDTHLQRLWIGNWARATLWILGVESRYEGPAPKSPFFLVSNHLSYIDIPVLLARLDARFLAKSEVAGWPILGFLARTTGTLFIDRTRKRDLKRVLPVIQSVLDRGTGVIVFPEGTSTAGAEIERFKPSLFEVPVEMEMDVSCAALHYDCPDGPLPAWQVVCWWGDAPFGPHFIQFLKQPRTIATVTFSPETVGPGGPTGPRERKEMAAAAHVVVQKSFAPSRPIESRATATKGTEAPPTDALHKQHVTTP